MSRHARQVRVLVDTVVTAALQGHGIAELHQLAHGRLDVLEAALATIERDASSHGPAAQLRQLTLRLREELPITAPTRADPPR